jgi:hypothetical protein
LIFIIFLALRPIQKSRAKNESHLFITKKRVAPFYHKVALCKKIFARTLRRARSEHGGRNLAFEEREKTMKSVLRGFLFITICSIICALLTACGSVTARIDEKNGGASPREKSGQANDQAMSETLENQTETRNFVPQRGDFDVRVLVNGYPAQEYAAYGRRYIEAAPNAEYSIQIRNSLPVRVAVALSVDGLNTIDARRTTAWNASKWVLEPYETININGWQMSSSRARRFYFTTERDSYAAKLGRAADLGVISAVFYREQTPRAVIAPRRSDDIYRSENERREADKSASPSAAPNAQSSAEARRSAPSAGNVATVPSDEYAATGIGRNVQNDVTWVNLALDPRPVAQITMRYEFHDALVRLGVIPRAYPVEDALRRRERARGFADGSYCPEPPQR